MSNLWHRGDIQPWRSAQLSVLSNHDILDMIFQSLDEPQSIPWVTQHYSQPDFLQEASYTIYRRPDTKTCLLAAALTCKSFLHPALNVLWKVMDSGLLPLFKLLPSFVEVDESYWMLNGDLSPSDWQRFDRYAAQIRTLILRHETPWELVPGLGYFQLSSMRSAPFFPGLKTLYSICQSDQGTEGLYPTFYCLSPNLEAMHFLKDGSTQYRPDTEVFINTIASRLIRSADSLSEITISNDPPAELLAVLSSCHRLRSVQLALNDQASTIEALRTLGRLPSLKRLRLVAASWVRSLDVPMDIDSSAPTVVFNLLETLHMVADEHLMVKILASIHTPVLKEAELHTDWDSEAPDLPHIENLVSWCSSTTSLERLYVCNSTFVGLSEEHFTTLASMKLKSFCLNFVLAVDATLIQGLLSRGVWRGLRLCDLSLFNGNGGLEVPSLSILADFARYCPDLTQLTMCLDLRMSSLLSLKERVDHHFPLSVSNSVPSHLLYLGPSVGAFLPPPDFTLYTGEVASAIYRLFPRYRLFGSNFTGNREEFATGMNFWEEVAGKVALIAKADPSRPSFPPPVVWDR